MLNEKNQDIYQYAKTWLHLYKCLKTHKATQHMLMDSLYIVKLQMLSLNWEWPRTPRRRFQLGGDCECKMLIKLSKGLWKERKKR